MKFPITLQINTAPVDFPMLPSIMRHQLRFFGNLCEEILVTVETAQSKKTMWKSEEWEDNLNKIRTLCSDLQKEYPHLRINELDYSESTRAKISEFFLGHNKKLLPLKDFRGGPSYSYYYGLYSAKSKYVFHLDSDILFYGNCEGWLSEAVDILQADQSILIAAPLIGPPKYEGPMPMIHKKRYNPTGMYKQTGHGYLYKDISSRLFMVEKARLEGFCLMTRPNLDQRVKALLRNTPAYHTPERSLTVAMQKAGMHRLDFLGVDPGFWSYHCPGHRVPEFMAIIDHAIAKIEEGFFTESQRGMHNFTTPFFDALKESFSSEASKTS